MQLLSLSASSAQTYEDCPDWWHAVYEYKATTPGGSAANLGSVDHAAFERWITEGHFRRWPLDCVEAQTKMMELVEEEYWKLFATRERLDEAQKLALRWLARQDWTGREVVSAERKDRVDLVLPDGSTVPFSFIMDRVDSLDGGKTIEIVDYKSISRPVQPSDLEHMIQARAYGAIARILFPDATRIWVTFDLLRYEPVGTRFTVAQCDETLAYLINLAVRIIADQEHKPTINDKCRWCPKKWDCDAIKGFIALSKNPTLMADIGDLARQRYETGQVISALTGMLTDLDAVIQGDLDAHDLSEGTYQDTDENKWDVGMRSQRRRTTPAAAELATVVGSVKALSVAGRPSVKDMQDMIDDPTYDAETKNQLRRLMGYMNTKASLTVKPA